MRRYGCTKRNPNPKWPSEQAVIAVPLDSQTATAAKMNNSLRTLETPEISDRIKPGNNENAGSDAVFFRENNMPIMGFMQEDRLRPQNSLGNLQSPICTKTDVASYLCQKVGRYARVEFLFGENTHVEKTGILESVGKDFIVLTESGTGSQVVCSSKNIKFINIYNLNNG